MKIYNKSGNGLSHVLHMKDKEGKISSETYFIQNGGIGEVHKEIADIWLKIKGVEEYVEPADVEKAKKEAEAKAKSEKKMLEDENAKLKAELEKLKAKSNAKKETETKDIKK